MSYTATSAVNQVLEAVIGMMNTLNLFASVTRGALPTGNGITVELGPSSPFAMHMDKNTVVPLDVTINGKHGDLKTLSDTMNQIHWSLTRERSYPDGAAWQIVDISDATLPQVIGREANNDWLMASSLSVKIYLRGE